MSCCWSKSSLNTTLSVNRTFVSQNVRSSSLAERDFCRDCGTPLSFRRIDGPRIEIMTGAFDRPDRLVPIRQYGTESRLGWVVAIANLSSQTTLQNYGQDKLSGIVSHQHPDHD